MGCEKVVWAIRKKDKKVRMSSLNCINSSCGTKSIQRQNINFI